MKEKEKDKWLHYHLNVDYDNNARYGYYPIFNGKVGQVLQDEKGREYYRRSPGVRAIIDTGSGLIISKEIRNYLDRKWDYRLPGGKVADTLLEYLIFLKRDGEDNCGNEPMIRDALIKELEEEVGITFVRYGEGVSLYHLSPSSASVEHDLYYFLIKKFEKVKSKPEKDEVIKRLELPYRKVWELIQNRRFSEDRTRAVLYEFLLKEKKQFIF